MQWPLRGIGRACGDSGGIVAGGKQLVEPLDRFEPRHDGGGPGDREESLSGVPGCGRLIALALRLMMSDRLEFEGIKSKRLNDYLLAFRRGMAVKEPEIHPHPLFAGLGKDVVWIGPLS